MANAVHAAMAASRAAKRRLRKMWIQEAVRIAESSTIAADDTLYLTLAGADGPEIDMLIKKGIVRLTEVGNVTLADAYRVVAVECDKDAEKQLREAFPGIKVIADRLENLLRISSPTAWPQGRELQICRARIVNLDLNGSLECIAGEQTFPVTDMILKLARIHERRPHLDWTLYLTLNATLTWDDPTCREIREFLVENFQREPVFAAGAEKTLGTDLFNAINGDTLDWRGMSALDCQHLLMVFVPKKIAQMSYGTPWKITTTENLEYKGGGPKRSRAPMVTWMIHFEWEPRARIQPDLVYRENLRSALQNTGSISTTGKLIRL